MSSGLGCQRRGAGVYQDPYQVGCGSFPRIVPVEGIWKIACVEIGRQKYGR